MKRSSLSLRENDEEKMSRSGDLSLSNWVLEPIDENGAGIAIIHRQTGHRHEYSFANSLVRNVPHPPFIQEKVWEAQRSQLAFRSEDVFVATFAKCGTTLTEQIVLLLLNSGKDEELNPLHKNTLDCTLSSSGESINKVGKIWTEMAVIDGLAGLNDNDNVKDEKACMGEGKARMSLKDFDALPSPRILKTHAPTTLFLDQRRAAKVIYVTRNPFDACVSCYYHPKPGVSPHSRGMPFDAFCKLWLSDRVEFGGWIDHVKGWRAEYQNQKHDNILWISYEELVGQPISTIQTIANFLGVDTVSDPSLVQRVARGCQFDAMKKAAQVRIENGAQGDISHLRNGKIGDWRTHFSYELFQEFETEVRSHFTNDGMGLEYDIGERSTWKLENESNGNAISSNRSVGYPSCLQIIKGVIASENESEDLSCPDITRAHEAANVPIKTSQEDDLNLEGPENNTSQDTTLATNPSPVDKKRLQDIQILGMTMIFYNLLQITLQYVNEFHVDDLRDANGLKQPTNFPAISLVIANIFNGVNGGLALSTAMFSGKMIRRVWNSGSCDNENNSEKFLPWFFVSILVEALVTSGVMHSVAHRLFGATLDGNAYVEFFSHIGYTVNVIATATLLICWLAPTFLNGSATTTNSHGISRLGGYPKPAEICLAITISILAVFFTQQWVPYEPDPEDFDYNPDHDYNEPRIIFLQRNVQGILEGILLIPTVLLLFILRRLWISIQSSISHDEELKLSYDTFRICILSVAVPLTLNWFHFRCHDNLVRFIQPTFGWEHSETIAAIRMTFHIPAWIFSLCRTHYFRLLTEEHAGWPKLDIIETICPGREVFPFAMVFLYRASEGMTIALLPTFFGQLTSEYFYLDITGNTWVAVTVLGMFVGNAIGAFALGHLMQKKGYKFAYILMCVAFLVVFLLYMIPHSNASFLALRCISALLFPGPVALSKITQNTRKSHRDLFKHIPMLVSLVWFNQGFWFGGVISNSSVWTPWNVFFTSAVVLFALFVCVFIAFLVKNKKKDQVEKKCQQMTSLTHHSVEDDFDDILVLMEEFRTNNISNSENEQSQILQDSLMTTVSDLNNIDINQGDISMEGFRETCDKGGSVENEVVNRRWPKPKRRLSVSSAASLLSSIASCANEYHVEDEDKYSDGDERYCKNGRLLSERRQSLPHSFGRSTNGGGIQRRRSLGDSIKKSGDCKNRTEHGNSSSAQPAGFGDSLVGTTCFANGSYGHGEVDSDLDTSEHDGEIFLRKVQFHESNGTQSVLAVDRRGDDTKRNSLLLLTQQTDLSNAATQEGARKNTLLLARLSSFVNGASFACHISLLPIQVTTLVNLDLYEYATIVSSLGSISTVLILMSFKWMARKPFAFSMAVAYCGHIVGTAVLCIPQIYTFPMGVSVSSIVISYGIVLLSFFIMSLSCDVSLGQKSLQQKNKDAAAGVQMGIIKSFLSLGKVCGAAMVVFTFRYHPQLPLWILEILLLVGASLTAAFRLKSQQNVGFLTSLAS